MTDDETILRTEHLTKRFGSALAVDDLSLGVRRGQVFGFLGPNGAGKTTTIGMMLGLIKPTAGKVQLFGLDATQDLSSILPRVGVVAENPAFYLYLSGWDNLCLLSRVGGGVDVGGMERVVEMVGLASRSKDKYQTYSTGMRQRLSVACALLHDPEFIILDEPTKGLDPAGMKDTRDLIVRLGEEGKTIFLSSHLLYEVEQVCDYIAIIKQGRMLAQGRASELLQRGTTLQLRVTDPDRAMEVLRGVSWLSSLSRDGELLLMTAPAGRFAEISAILARNDIFLSEMKTRESTLESFFLEVTAEE
jgi:ABC-2 type transport system ATP-binding protein